MAYADIEGHGVIGNLRTTALVCTNGTIDFFCYPRFDSPTVFAALLDDEKGGHFYIAPEPNGVRTRQMYLSGTNVLVTRFMSDAGMAEVINFMPVCDGGPRSAIVRCVKGIRGSMTFCMACEPRLDYARAATREPAQRWRRRVSRRGRGGVLPPAGERAAQGHEGRGRGDLHARSGRGGRLRLRMQLRAPERGRPRPVPDNQLHRDRSVLAGLERAVALSRPLARARRALGAGAEAADLGRPRSVLVAATFGLPEWVGGGRNWDYRYCWIRDAAFTVYALMRLGYTDEATAFIGWVEERGREGGEGERLQILYGLDGTREASEEELDHLAGYRGSRPVRIGNAAADQLQLDIFGELVDAIYLADKNGVPASIDTWRGVAGALDWVCENWQQPDEGIWEVRGGRQAFLSGRLMCWVALNRGLRMANQLARPASLERWRQTQDAIAHSIYKGFWNEEKRAFVQHPVTDALDAAALLMRTSPGLMRQ